MGTDTRNPIYPAGPQQLALWYLPGGRFASHGTHSPRIFLSGGPQETRQRGW